MPKVSINILTYNRPELLKKALASIKRQTFRDYEVRLVNDGNLFNTELMDKEFVDAGLPSLNFVVNNQHLGITASRQFALEQSEGEYVAILDDDDEWSDPDKLKKQVKFLDENKDFVLVGGQAISGNQQLRLRPETDGQIRKTMLFRNNFFTSTVMFRKQAAIEAGGFIKDGDDFAEDYDLWLRLRKKGKMYNFQEVFTGYRNPSYNREKFKAFLGKQLRLIKRYRADYPNYLLAMIILKIRIFL